MHKKYILENVGTQKYTIRNFRNCQMTKDWGVSFEIHDYHLLINELAIEDIKLLEPFVATYLVKTFLEFWKDYKNKMNTKRNKCP